MPLPEPLARALAGNAQLAALGQRLSQSRQRFELASSVLPVVLRSQVRAGVLDEEGWTLLASNAAAAAKLRHCLPLIEAALCDAGWPPVALRVRLASV